MTAPPRDEAQLLERANALAGRTLGDIAFSQGLGVPGSKLRAKGWSGQLLERALGAGAQSLSEPDFPHLGIELKTLPINAVGKPLESTFVCVVPLSQHLGLTYERSCVGRKLDRVLWMPLIVPFKGALAEQSLAIPLLWSPDSEERTVLKRDWEESMELVALGRVDQISAQDGVALQVRPKAANAKAVTRGTDADGRRIATLPRGFYLRPSFTAALLKRRFS